MDAVLEAMFARHRVEVLLVRQPADPDAPFDVTGLPAAARCEPADDAEGFEALDARLAAFRPDLLLVTSWNHPTYRRLCRAWAGRLPRVMQMDNQWHGTAKQWAGVLASPLFVRRLADFAFVPGDRQARFARYLGFPRQRVLRPSLSGRTHAFAAAAAGVPLAARKAFLFVGRLVPEKGVDVLAAAYRRYRAQASDPWPLIVCGAGPAAGQLDGAGIEHRGFVQPAELPEIFAHAACLVLPSRFEPWAVAIHEAAAGGLAVICSAACGAGDHFVDRAGRNGAVVPTGDVAALSEAMRAVACWSDDRLEAARLRSLELAATVTPADWGDRLAQLVTSSGPEPRPRPATPPRSAVKERADT
jgi:glycosyltransferase involved in cell wall biosynthesis